MADSEGKRVSLVLGSGGARGAAHIGVIRWLEEHQYDIRSVSGCSIGALVGGVYAAGKLDEFEDWICAITEREMFRLMGLAWQTSGLLKGDRIIDTLKDLVGDCDIADLPITYTAVAASLDGEKEVWLQDGRLFDAIRASMALPLLLTPHRRNGKTLIDGGVLNPVPIAPTFSDATDLCIAVNLGGKSEKQEQADSKKTAGKSERENASGVREKISAFIDKLGIGSDDEGQDMGPVDIANQAFDAMQATISRQKLAVYPPDILIDIPRNACGTLAFDRSEEMIELGREKAGSAVEQYCS